MATYYPPDLDLLQEVISSKKTALKTVEDHIGDLRLKMRYLHLQEQDVAQLEAPPQPLGIQENLEFQQLQDALDAAQERAENLQKSIAVHTALHPPPAYMLPAEIWSYILLLCMDLGDVSFLEWGTPSFPPLIFGSVCSFFHIVTLSNPYMWSCVSIHILPGGKWRNMMNLLLERSGTVPLSLELIWYPAKDDPSVKDTLALLNELVAPHFSRLRRLQLFIPSNALKIMLGSPLPSLEYLALGSEIAYVLGHPDHVPNLRTVLFASVHSTPLQWDLPWSQLTEVTSKRELSGSEVLRLLMWCPLLERCRLRVGRYNPTDFDPAPVGSVVMPRLRSLVLIISRAEDPFGLFDQLVLPSLTEVEFHSASARTDIAPGHDMTIWPKPPLASLVSRSECTLERLVMVGLLTYEIEIRDIVKCIPSLTSFEVYSKGIDIVPSDVKSVLLERSLQ